MISDRNIHLVSQLGLIVADSHETEIESQNAECQIATENGGKDNLFTDLGDLCIGLLAGQHQITVRLQPEVVMIMGLEVGNTSSNIDALRLSQDVHAFPSSQPVYAAELLAARANSEKLSVTMLTLIT